MKTKTDGLSPTTRIIDISLQEFDAWLTARERRRAAEKRLEEENDACGLSLSKAAAIAHRRPETVLQALRTGALPGNKVRSRWIVSAGALRVWVDNGCSITPSAKVG